MSWNGILSTPFEGGWHVPRIVAIDA